MSGPPPVASAGAFEGRVHRLAARVYYEDTDMSGVVYHANYLRYFERGRSDYLRCAGIVHAQLLERDPPMAFAVTAIDVRYRRAARIDDSLVIETTYDRLDGPRLHIAQRIVRDGVEIATARVEAVCIDLSGRARRPLRELVTALTPLLAPPE